MLKKRSLMMGLGLLTLFALWTLAVRMVDVQSIGPGGSAVGFATLNQLVHNCTGVNWTLYTVTDWLGLVPVAVALGFGLLGLCQWIRRRKLRKVDGSILVLGGFYVAVLGAFVLFEELVINYRPVLIQGYLEASYPSSTTMLALCMMPTAMMQLQARLPKGKIRAGMLTIMAGFTVFMVVGRLLSGVHWISDIIGGILLSAGLVMLYHGFSGITFDLGRDHHP